MEHTQSAQGQQITIFLVTLALIIVVTAIYLSFIRKKKSDNTGH